MRSVTSVAETDDLNPVCKNHERAGNLLHIMSDTARAAGESDTQASLPLFTDLVIVLLSGRGPG